MGHWPHLGTARRAALSAFLMMAWQVAAKTARDSLFLTAYPARALPAMIGAASVCSILLALSTSRLLRRYGPFRVVPLGFLFSASLHGLEWWLLPRFPRVTPTLIYLHVLALGAVLLSGFWALANEHFDPHQARRRFGRIAAFGTLGGFAGGILAERISALFSNTDLLPLLLVLQCACGLVMLRFSAPKASPKRGAMPKLPEIIAHAPYLARLAGLMVLVSVTATTLDYLFKAEAVTEIGRGAALSRFFALFYMTTSAASFLTQASASRYWLDRFGLARTVATLPAGVASVALAALVAPGVLLLTVARGLELVLRGSLFRSGYELFYTPMPRAEKRSAKSVIDIGADRLGDGLGAAAVQLLLMLPAGAAEHWILALTVVLAAAAAWLSFRLDEAYRLVLGKNLAEHAPELKHVEVEDLATQTGHSTAISVNLAKAPDPEGRGSDAVLEQMAILRSGDHSRIRTLLRDTGLLEPALVPEVILLMGREEVRQAAHAALARTSFRISGHLADFLRDGSQQQAVRMRIPRLLAACGDRIAWQALLDGLEDRRFEIRFRCARSLDAMRQSHPEFRAEPAEVYRVLARELGLSGRDSGGRNASEAGEEGDQPSGTAGAEDARASQRLGYIFYLLGLVLPRAAVQTAFRALHTDDPRLHGVAMEYIESAVPREVREELCRQIEAPQAAKPESSPLPPLARLLTEAPAITARLEDLRARAQESGGRRKRGR
ncbi:MAG TPA: hypothetical protein VJ732_03505 [Bryobacteraceae bacterium]|nr:hypothetical protein [Bryobacteraceae bacterium]